MDETEQGDAENRKRRRRSVRQLRRRSDILPPINLNSLEEDPTNSDNGKTTTQTEAPEEPTVYGSMWLESKSPVKKKRRRRSSLFTGLPARPLLLEVDTEKAAEGHDQTGIGYLADMKGDSEYIHQNNDTVSANREQTRLVEHCVKEKTDTDKDTVESCAEISEFAEDKVTKTPTKTVIMHKEMVEFIEHNVTAESNRPNNGSANTISQDDMLIEAECTTRNAFDHIDKNVESLFSSHGTGANNKSDNANVPTNICGEEIAEKQNETREASNPVSGDDFSPVNSLLSPGLKRSYVKGNAESMVTHCPGEVTRSEEPIISMHLKDSDDEPFKKKLKRVWNVAVKETSPSSLEAVFNMQKYSPCSIGQKLEQLEELDHKRRISSSASQKNQDFDAVLDLSTESMNFSRSDPFNAGFVLDSLQTTPGTAGNNLSDLDQSNGKPLVNQSSLGVDQTVLTDDGGLSRPDSPKITDECVTPRSDMNVSSSSASHGSMSFEYPELSDSEQNDDKILDRVSDTCPVNGLFVGEEITTTEKSTNIEVTVDTNYDLKGKVEKCNDTIITEQVALSNYDTKEKSAFLSDEILPNMHRETPDAFTQLVEKRTENRVNEEEGDPNEISVANIAELQADDAVEKKLDHSDHSSDKENSILIDPLNGSMVVSSENVAHKSDADTLLSNEQFTEKQKNLMALEQNEKLKQTSKKLAKQNPTKVLKVKKNGETKGTLNVSSVEKQKASVTVKRNKLFKYKGSETFTVIDKELVRESEKQLLNKVQKEKLMQKTCDDKTLPIEPCELKSKSRNNKKEPVRKSNVDQKAGRVKSKKASRSEKLKNTDVLSMRDVVNTIAVDVPQTIIVGAVTESSMQPAPERSVTDLRVVTDVVGFPHEAVLERITDLKLTNDGHLESTKNSSLVKSNERHLTREGNSQELLSEGCLNFDVTCLPVSENEEHLKNDSYVQEFLCKVHLENDGKTEGLPSRESHTQSNKNCLGKQASESPFKKNRNNDSSLTDECVQGDVKTSASKDLCDKISKHQKNDSKTDSKEKDLSKDTEDLVVDNVYIAKQTNGACEIDKDIKVDKVKTKRRRSSRFTDIAAFLKTTENEKGSSSENSGAVECATYEQVSIPGPSKPKRRRSTKFDIVMEGVEDERGRTETKERRSDIVVKKRGRPQKCTTATISQSENITPSAQTVESPERSESLTQLTSDISKVTLSENVQEVLNETDAANETSTGVSESDKSGQSNTELLTVETLDLPDDMDQPSTSCRKRRRSADAATLKIQLTQYDVNSSPECTQSPEPGTKASGARSRKRKIVETPEIVEQIYRNKNYVKPEEHKPWVTIMEKADPAGEYMGKRKLQRFIDFDKPTQMKLRRRLQKARKNGWDPVKRHKSELKDDFVQVKLADLWSDLETVDRELDSNSLQNKLKSIVETQ